MKISTAHPAIKVNKFEVYKIQFVFAFNIILIYFKPLMTPFARYAITVVLTVQLPIFQVLV